TEMASEERCEICAVPLGQEHPHLVDLQRRQLCCACKPCALLFNNPGNEGGRYRAVPDRVLVDSGFELRRSDWTALGMPVGLAFIFFNSTLKRWVLTYPSPAGATESELEGDAWENFRVDTPLFRALEPDVEALQVYGQR